MIRVRKGRWMPPVVACKNNPMVKQFGVGTIVTYYHIQCKDYLRDNLVAEGTVVESLNRSDVWPYTWSHKLQAFTRVGYAKSRKPTSSSR